MAARDAWEAQGYWVHGAALSGKAAEGLAAYRLQGPITFEANAEAARWAIVWGYFADREAGRRAV